MDYRKLGLYAATSSLSGIFASIIYNNVRGSYDKDEKSNIVTTVSTNLVAALPAILIIPTSIQKTFINLYSVENPAILTYLYSISKSLPSLFGITVGRSLLIVSLAGLLTKNNNKRGHFLSTLFGALIYLYAKMQFFKSPLKGGLNVFHGDVTLSQMADSEVRIYKSMVRSFRETTVEKFLSMNEPLDAFLQRLPYIFQVSTQSIMMPFKNFLERESKILKIGKQEMDNISIGAIQNKLNIKAPGSLSVIDQYTDGVMKIMTRSPGEGPEYRKHTEYFMTSHGNTILQEMNSSLTEYGVPTVVCVLTGSISFQCTTIVLDEASEWYNEGKPLTSCCMNVGRRLWSDFSSVILIVVGCGVVEYYTLK